MATGDSRFYPDYTLFNASNDPLYKYSTAGNTTTFEGLKYTIADSTTNLPIYSTGLGTVTINTADPSYLDYLKRIQAEMERQIGIVEKATKPELVDLKELLFG